MHLVRKKSTVIRIVDDDGKTIYSWTVGEEGESEQTPAVDDPQQVAALPVHLEHVTASDEELAMMTAVAQGREPAVWILLTLTDCAMMTDAW